MAIGLEAYDEVVQHGAVTPDNTYEREQEQTAKGNLY
jgi:hypothetical protein